MLHRAGVRYRVPEMLRHTFASTLLSRNAPLLYVQKQGVWTSAAVVLHYYSAWMPESPPGATRRRFEEAADGARLARGRA